MSIKDKLYHYKATVSRVIDGDTFIVDRIDLGFNISLVNQKVRILGINTMELRDKDEANRALAFEARDFMKDTLEGKEIVIKSEGFDSFGRILAKVWLDDVDMGNELLGAGLAVSFKK